MHVRFLSFFASHVGLFVFCVSIVMSHKRQPDETASPDHEKRRKFNLRSVVEEVIKMRSVQHLLEPILEPLIRRVVKEEIEVALKRHLANIKRNGSKEIESVASRCLKLQFVNNLSLPIFTGARIEAEDCPTVKVVLLDVRTGNIVNSGPESSAKMEIVVLEGDFDSEEAENWTAEEFRTNIVREREGKKPLLTGDVILNLKEGICTLGEISFTDNSSWTRSRKFRLGARVLDNFHGVRIQEAKTESFIVRDHRGELYKKHHPPSLFDEVWRLEKIGKDGAFHKRLTRENILTVKDFLTVLFLDPARLRQILGTGMSAKMWEVTMEHARTCVVDKRVHLYYPPTSQQKTGVVFNIVGQVMGLLRDSQYVHVDKLAEAEKVDAQSWVLAAFEHWNEVLSFDDESALLGGSSQLSNVTYTSSLPRSETSDTSKLLVSQKMEGFDFAQPSSSSPDIISSIYSAISGSDDYSFHNIENMLLRYDPTLSFPSQICDTDSLTQAFSDEDHMQLFDSELLSHSHQLEAQADLQTAVDGFLMARSTSAASNSTGIAVDNAQRRWRKLSTVLKWFCIRKLVASKRTRFQEIHRYKPL